MAQNKKFTGPAQLLTTISVKPQKYEIMIDKVNHNDGSPNKNMVIRVTDPTLLAKTGGIVQGMSGSPILQNGKLVGAVNHVFVNDPTKGYGIFIENMENTMQSVETTLSKAS
jgi:stage IV sporulation protein B